MITPELRKSTETEKYIEQRGTIIGISSTGYDVVLRNGIRVSDVVGLSGLSLNDDVFLKKIGFQYRIANKAPRSKKTTITEVSL